MGAYPRLMKNLPDDLNRLLYEINKQKVDVTGLQEDVAQIKSNPILGVTLGSGETGLFFVSRNYSGVGVAVVTNGKITSTNDSYMQQLAKARMGDILNPYPDPYAARIAAQQIMEGDLIKYAVIIIQSNNTWTIGSDDPTKNGDSYGNDQNTQFADIIISQTVAADLKTGPYVQKNFFSYFGLKSGFVYIVKRYAIPLLNNNYIDATDPTFEAGIFGKGEFTYIYGPASGAPPLLLTTNNPNANIYFEAYQVKLQEFSAINLSNFERVVFNVEHFYSGAGNTFRIGNTVLPQSGKMPALSINLKNMSWGFGQVPGVGPERNLGGAAFNVNTCYNPMKVDIKVGNYDVVCFNGGPSILSVLSAAIGGTPAPPKTRLFGLLFTFEIDNLSETNQPTVGTTQRGLFNIEGGSISGSVCHNNLIHISIKNAKTDNPLGFYNACGIAGSNNKIIFHVGNHLRRAIGQPTVPVFQIPPAGTSPTFPVNGTNNLCSIHISGNFLTEEGGIFQGTNLYDTIEFSGTFRTKSATQIPFQLSDNEKVVFKDAVILAPNTVPNAVSSPNPREILSMGLYSNLPLTSNITVKGMAPVIDASLSAYFVPDQLNIPIQ